MKYFKKKEKKITFFLNFFLIISLFLSYSCSGNLFRKVDTRNTPINAEERARKNVAEGRGVSISNAIRNRGSSNYEFSTSNPMWRATLEILDFIPFATVDYSGGIIITDWYSDNNSSNNSSLKITVRFLNNEIQTNSFKVIVHEKLCRNGNTQNCTVKEIDTKIKEELTRSILTKAAIINSEKKN